MTGDQIRQEIRELRGLLNSYGAIVVSLLDALEARGLVGRREVLDGVSRRVTSEDSGANAPERRDGDV